MLFVLENPDILKWSVQKLIRLSTRIECNMVLNFPNVRNLLENFFVSEFPLTVSGLSTLAPSESQCNLCVTWFGHVCDMIHSYGWHDPFIRVTWHTNTHVFMGVTRVTSKHIHTRDVTYSYGWRDSFIRMTHELVHVSMDQTCHGPRTEEIGLKIITTAKISNNWFTWHIWMRIYYWDSRTHPCQIRIRHGTVWVGNMAHMNETLLLDSITYPRQIWIRHGWVGKMEHMNEALPLTYCPDSTYTYPKPTEQMEKKKSTVWFCSQNKICPKKKETHTQPKFVSFVCAHCDVCSLFCWLSVWALILVMRLLWFQFLSVNIDFFLKCPNHPRSFLVLSFRPLIHPFAWFVPSSRN